VAVPLPRGAAVDSVSGFVQSAGRPAGEHISGSLWHPNRFQPALAHHARDRGPDGRWADPERREQPYQSGDGRAATTRPQVIAVKIEKG